MKSAVLSVASLALALGAAGGAAAQDKARNITVTLTVPSTAYRLQIKEVYKTDKALWVYSSVKGGGIGLTVISKVKASAKVTAPDLPVRHFIVGKSWNWTQEKKYTYVKSRKQFVKMVEKAGAKLIYKSKGKGKGKGKKGAQGKNRRARYIVGYRKEIFIGGRTREGLTLELLAKKHAKQFDGKFGRLLKIINGYTVELTPANADRLKRLPQVRFIELDRPVGIGLPRP